MSEENKEPQGLTPEQAEEKRKELMTFYKKELPLLRLRKEYEEAITAIDVAKMTRLEIMMARAQMMAPPPESPEEKPKEHEIPHKERSLKKANH